MIKIQNLINGELTDALSGEFLENVNPATGKVYSLIPDSDHRDIEDAVKAAKNAFPVWSQLSTEERSDYLKKMACAIKDNFEEFAIAETTDNGKPISLSRKIDIPRSIDNLNYFADEILNFQGEKFDDIGYGENEVIYSPLGVVGCISPWNLPLYLFTWKIAPALAAGCTVVAKPSEVTPMTAFLLSKYCANFLPPGVLNIVHGLGSKVGDAISTAYDIKAISFTGSTQTGQHISKMAAPSMKRLHLEMGGKNANIIFSDCDYEKMLETTLKSSFANQGQICLCGSRILVEDSIYDQFIQDFVKRVKLLKIGDPLNENTEQGAIVSKEHYNKIKDCLTLAKEEGAEFLTGTDELNLALQNKDGFFIFPTILIGLDQKAKTNQEEIFGPVVTIERFKTTQEAIEMANANSYGLAGSIWTRDIKKAKLVATSVESGILWINTWLLRDLRTPFGGVKNSGRGREGGQYILKFFSDTKNICIG